MQRVLLDLLLPFQYTWSMPHKFDSKFDGRQCFRLGHQIRLVLASFGYISVNLVSTGTTRFHELIRYYVSPIISEGLYPGGKKHGYLLYNQWT